MATVNPDQQNAIVNLYIALFNRAPDADGFEFWTQALANGTSLSTITAAFFVSPEAATAYPASQTAEQFVGAFYQTVFGRTADADGLVFWTDVLNSAGGIGSEAAKALLVSKIVDIVSAALDTKPADLTDAQYAETVRDRTIFSKKNLAATDFVINQKGTDLEAAKQALLDALAPAPVPGPTNQTFTLTTDIDTPVGGAGNDTFNALSKNGVNTLNDEDIVDGGAGVDTLNVELNGSSSFVTPTLRSIEVVNVRALGYSSLLLDSQAGVREINVANSEDSAFIYNVGDAALSVAHQTEGVYFSGSTATALSLTFTEVGNFNLGRAALLGAPAGVTVDLAYDDTAYATTHNIVASNSQVRFLQSVESAAVLDVNITATGENLLQLSEAVADTVKAITVAGSGSVNLGDNALKALISLTAGDGGVQFVTDNQTASTLTISTGAGRDDIDANAASIKSLNVGGGDDYVYLNGALSATAVVNLGAGNDTVRLERGSAKGAVVNGGDGDDTIITGAVSHHADAVAATFEVAELIDGKAGAAIGDSFTIAGLTWTSKYQTSPEIVAYAFANLKDGAQTGVAASVGTYSGTFTGYETTRSGNKLTFTATTYGDKEDLTISGTGAEAISSFTVKTQGAANIDAVTGSVDTLTGGAGADTFVFTTDIVGTTAGKVTAIITDFATGVDKIEVFSDGTSYVGTSSTFVKAQNESLSLEDLLADAASTLSGGKLYYVGQFGQDSYLVTDYETGGYTNVIKLENVALVGINATDLVGTAEYAPPPP